MESGQTPAFLVLGTDELARRAGELRMRNGACDWCPRNCGADRANGVAGACGGGPRVLVASANLHFGEERHFVGFGGSGTVFFAGCNLGCLFCQNHDISHGQRGTELTPAELARVFLLLQEQGAENINLVTPSHFPADILAALAIGAEQGLKLPIVWNSSGYDSVATLKLLDGAVDIYMPDFKFATDTVGERLTEVADYATVARAALTEMVRQVGPGLVLDDGIARRGMSVRHLVLPGHLDDSRACLDFLCGLSPELTVNVMSQYRPAYRAREVPALSRTLSRADFADVVAYGRRIGLANLLAQG